MSENKTDESIKNEQPSPETNGELRSNLRDRLLLPFGIPLIVAAVIALLGISFSRVFLAGANKGAEAGVAEAVEHASKSSAPVIWATIITLIVLFGAAGISLMRSMRTTSFVLIVAGGIVAVIVAGSVLAGAGEEVKLTADYGKPTEADMASADPANKIEVDALGTNQFQSKEFEAAAGVLNIAYVGKGGSHQLKIKDSRYNWFDLVVNAGTTQAADVLLEPGTYYIFCPIPGHEAAGMYADLVIK